MAESSFPCLICSISSQCFQGVEGESADEDEFNREGVTFLDREPPSASSGVLKLINGKFGS